MQRLHTVSCNQEEGRFLEEIKRRERGSYEWYIFLHSFKKQGLCRYRMIHKIKEEKKNKDLSDWFWIDWRLSFCQELFTLQEVGFWPFKHVELFNWSLGDVLCKCFILVSFVNALCL